MESIFDILYIPMGYLLRFAYSITNNYLLAIFLFTLVFEILLSPLSVKQQKNQIRQASLAPKAAAIRKKYAGRNDQATQQKMQNELMDMYQAENYNPMAGCGSLLIQFPIIICLYNVITQPLRYICNLPSMQVESLLKHLEEPLKQMGSRMPQIDAINLIKDDVAQYYPIAENLRNAVIPDFTVGPFDLSQNPDISFQPFNWLMLIPVVTFIVMVLSTEIMKKFTYQAPETKEQQNSLSMKIMTWSMPLLSVYLEFKMAAAIGVYWVFRNILQVVIKIIIAKIWPLPTLTEEDYKEAERQANLSNKQKKREDRENRKPVRSLHHIDDEEYLARHAHDFEEPASPAESDSSDEQPKGDTTASKAKLKNGEDPAPIKNDDKSSYKEKK